MKIAMTVWGLTLLFWLGGCVSSQPEPKLQLHAKKMEVYPPAFEAVWKGGKNETNGDRMILRSENQSVYIITPEKNGKKDGIVRRYDKRNKKIRFETTYRNGVRDGWAREYSVEGGWPYKAVRYRHGEKREVREYNQKGEMIRSIPWLDGKKHGVEQKYSYVSGDLIYRLTYDHGTEKKLVTYCKGKPEVEMVLNGCRQGMERVWYCGTERVKRETPYRDCKKNGVEKSYDKQGNLRYSVTWRNGVKEGPAKAYYPDGKVKYTLLYHNDKPDELGWYYDSAGKKERIDYDTLMAFAERFPKGFDKWWRAL